MAVDGDGAVVAEAGYELLPDGDGELAMTVAKRYRCPVLADRPCPLAEGADVVVLANAAEHEPW